MDAAWASLGRTLDLCLAYLVVVVGSVLLTIAVFKLAAWIADRRRQRRDTIEPCIKCGGAVVMATPSTRVCQECGAREFLAGVFAKKE